jgi:hypothetical protein
MFEVWSNGRYGDDRIVLSVDEFPVDAELSVDADPSSA